MKDGTDSAYNYSTWRSVDDALSLVSVSSEFEYHNISQVASPFEAQQWTAEQRQAGAESAPAKKHRQAEKDIKLATNGATDSSKPSEPTRSMAAPDPHQHQQQKPPRLAMKNSDDMRFPSFLASQNELVSSPPPPPPSGSAKQSSSLLNLTTAKCYNAQQADANKLAEPTAATGSTGSANRGEPSQHSRQLTAPSAAPNQANGTITKQRAKLVSPPQIKYQNLASGNGVGGGGSQQQQQLENVGNVRARIMRMEQRQFESGRKHLLVSTPNLSLLASAGAGQGSSSLAASSNRASVGGAGGRRLAPASNRQSATPSGSLIPVPVFGSGRHLATAQTHNAPPAAGRVIGQSPLSHRPAGDAGRR